MREWIQEALWGNHYFEPERLGPKTVLHTTDYYGPLVSVLIDGHVPRAPWNTDELFNRLRPLAERYQCSWIYITDHDDAFSELKWEQAYNSRWFARQRLFVFEHTPAEEGGKCHLVLAFHDRRGVIVFALQPGRHFEIAFYGQSELLTEIQDCL